MAEANFEKLLCNIDKHSNSKVLLIQKFRAGAEKILNMFLRNSKKYQN